MKKVCRSADFKQLIDFIPKIKFEILAKKHQTDRYYKSFCAWTQLVTMLFRVFSRCNSMGKICDGMLAMHGKLNHLGFDNSPAKSTADDDLRERDNEFFKEFYFLLLKHFEPLLSVSRIDNISFDKLFIFDSSTISLFSQVMKGAGRNQKGECKKKGGLKVHMLIDAHSQTSTFVKFSEAKLHDKNFLKYLNLPEFSIIVFDRAYNHYLQFAKFTQNKINFTFRLKSNAVYEVVQESFCQIQGRTGFGVLKEEHIHLKYKEENQEKNLCLRKVVYRDDKGRIYEFITNNFEISIQEVALIYKIRW
ncbi:IS4 family transposase [Flavobacterium sp. RSP49]|uniref:IS4 family transposase n=1 Tax=Flavobacterium sp. RSP49 TaxID=2497487 RepID=UPI0013152149|nr:IS4 family transposase [Flavobacterium sp. RSP49]